MATRSAAATRLTTKGHVVIPKAVQSAVGWRSGTRLRVETEGDVVTLRPVGPSSVKDWLADVAGCVQHGDPVGDLEAEHRADFAAEEAALVADGKLRAPQGPLPASFWRRRAPGVSAADVTRAIRADRDED